MLKKILLIVLIVIAGSILTKILLNNGSKYEGLETVYHPLIDNEITGLRLMKKVYDTTIPPINYFYKRIECATQNMEYHEISDRTIRDDQSIQVNGISLREELKQKKIDPEYVVKDYCFITKKDTLFYIRSYYNSLRPNTQHDINKLRVAQPIGILTKEDSLFMYYKPFKNSKIKIEKSENQTGTSKGGSYSYAHAKIHIKLVELNLYGNARITKYDSIRESLREMSLRSIEIDNYKGLKYENFEYYYYFTENSSVDFFKEENVLNNKAIKFR